jgi:hypothetical protein
MNRRILLTLTVLLSLSCLITVTNAHIPKVPDDGTTLGTATEIIEPWKSWFYHTQLDAGEIHYYSFEATEGERIRFMLNIPIPEGDRGFTPGLVLMGSDVPDQGTPPSGLEVPVGAGVMVFTPGVLEPEYEGFTPLSQYTTVDLNMSAPSTGTFYVGVYTGSTGGRYALITGYVEAYSLLQWVTVPSMAITIIMWSGQSLLFILLLMFLPLILGLAFLTVRHKGVFGKERALTLIGTIGGLLFLGSSFSFFTQMILSLIRAPYNWTVIVSIIFATIPLILGLAVIQILRSEDWVAKRSRKIALVLIAIVAPFVWAGLYLGPLLVLVAGVVPLFR